MSETITHMPTLVELQDRLRSFTRARDWKQFHTPKNLAMALAGEVGELNALLQWTSPDDIEQWLAVPANAEALRFEIADVLTYLLLLADAVDVDPVRSPALRRSQSTRSDTRRALLTAPPRSTPTYSRLSPHT